MLCNKFTGCFKNEFVFVLVTVSALVFGILSFVCFLHSGFAVTDSAQKPSYKRIVMTKHFERHMRELFGQCLFSDIAFGDTDHLEQSFGSHIRSIEIGHTGERHTGLNIRKDTYADSFLAENLTKALVQFNKSSLSSCFANILRSCRNLFCYNLSIFCTTGYAIHLTTFFGRCHCSREINTGKIAETGNKTEFNRTTFFFCRSLLSFRIALDILCRFIIEFFNLRFTESKTITCSHKTEQVLRAFHVCGIFSF